MEVNSSRLVLCYVSGFDLRRVDAEVTPFVADALARYPWTTFTNLPSNELFPTLVTGVDPTEHGVWGVRIRDPLPRAALAASDLVPESLAAAVQGGVHLFTGDFDLAAIPPRRRRRFAITRMKYKRRANRTEALFRIGGIPTVFDVVGRAHARYLFDASYEPERTALPRLCTDGARLEVLELYSLDRHQQWNADRPEEVTRFYARVDSFLRLLQGKCGAAGYSLMVVSDHGHEPIRGSYDLPALLARAGVPAEDYDYFTEVSSARFWFHTAEARERTLPLLASIPHASVTSFSDMGRFGIPLPDASYGEVFVYLEPGHIFFPHDFHNPVANVWL